eukprot:127460-Hanusia_phi.AAC.3
MPSKLPLRDSTRASTSFSTLVLLPLPLSTTLQGYAPGPAEFFTWSPPPELGASDCSNENKQLASAGRRTRSWIMYPDFTRAPTTPCVWVSDSNARRQAAT